MASQAARRLSPSEHIARLRQQRIAAARVGINSAVELVLHDEATGEPVVQAPMHREWHALADQHARLVIMAHIESAKTQNLSIARTLFELGRNPNLRIAVISNTHGQAVKIVRAIAQHIERNDALHAIFPDLKPDPRGPWSETQLAVKRSVVSKDVSVQAFGVHGAIVGSRLDRIILDDICDYENTRTPESRKDLIAWLDSMALTRLTANGRVIAVGTALHQEDALHVFEGRGWPTYRYPVQDETGAPRWAERWPLPRIEQKRLELGVYEAGRALDLEVLDDTAAHMKRAWLDDALAAGERATALSWTDAGEPALLHVPEGGRVVIGVDPAVSKRDAADLSALVAVLVREDKTRELLAVETGHWSGPEIIQRTKSVYSRFGASMVVVETVAAQQYLAQWLKELGSIRVEGYTTGKGKLSLEYRCEQVGAELARRQWIFPSIEVPGTSRRPRDKEIGLLVKDLAYYSPSAHTPDRVSALCMAQVGCERVGSKVGWVPLPPEWHAR